MLINISTANPCFFPKRKSFCVPRGYHQVKPWLHLKFPEDDEQRQTLILRCQDCLGQFYTNATWYKEFTGMGEIFPKPTEPTAEQIPSETDPRSAPPIDTHQETP